MVEEEHRRTVRARDDDGYRRFGHHDDGDRQGGGGGDGDGHPHGLIAAECLLGHGSVVAATMGLVVVGAVAVLIPLLVEVEGPVGLVAVVVVVEGLVTVVVVALKETTRLRPKIDGLMPLGALSNVKGGCRRCTEDISLSAVVGVGW